VTLASVREEQLLRRLQADRADGGGATFSWRRAFSRLLTEKAPDVEAIGGVTMGRIPSRRRVDVSFIQGRPLPAF